MFDPETLGADEVDEIERFRLALDLEESFAFHVIVAATRDVLEAALARLTRQLKTLQPRPPRDTSPEEAAAQILAELDQAIEASAGSPVLLDAMVADQEPAWAIVFQRLNELRNGLERRHSAPLIIAVSTAGEAFLGREAPDLWSRRGSGMRLRAQRSSHRADVALERHPSPPTDAETFEALCFDLFREIWNDPGAQRYGRSGQPVAGVDVFGRAAGRRIGVQCKVMRDRRHGRLVSFDLKREVEKARTFVPQLHTFILATTASRDARLRERARSLTRAGGLEVQVWAWDDIWQELSQRPALLARISPIVWPQQRINPSRLPVPTDKFFGREAAMAKLDAAWTDPGIHIVTLVGWAGGGKTTLVTEWAAKLKKRDYDGADYFDWSFYSLGTRGGVTAEPFIDAALRFFGDGGWVRSALSPWEKGAFLARLIARRRTLLILDGLEPLQQPPGPTAGALKEPAMEALLQGLGKENPGLCVLTTRESIPELQPFHTTSAPELELEGLSRSAGVTLLRALGVEDSSAELESLVENTHGHAFTLSLLGRFLRDSKTGDARRSEWASLSQADAEAPSDHLRRLMAFFERWLKSEGEWGERGLAIMRLASLYDSPASAASLDALRRPPDIPDLTENLVSLSDAQWQQSIAQLVEAGLVTVDHATKDAALDAHPLVRKYFGRQLREHQPDAWKAAHGRLFDHLKGKVAYRPDTLEDLQPLYQAVAHGCQAGRYKEALDDVYRDRILRGDEHYSKTKLGAFGADLGSVACFFEEPWSRVVSSLPASDRAWLLNEAAFLLRALGRLKEALQPMRSGLEVNVDGKDWRNAAIFASNLSRVELTLGGMADAIRDAERSVAFADRSDDVFRRIVCRTMLADALHHAGRSAVALACFREAEAMQAESQPSYPLLYSLSGFRYCDLLLADTERAAWQFGSVIYVKDEVKNEPIALCREVEARAARTLEWSRQNQMGLLDVALDRLTLGRARLYRALLEGSSLHEAKAEIGDAVVGLRQSGELTFLSLSLLTRAWLRFAQGDAEGARVDLDETQGVTERGPMPLILADVQLYRARFFHDRDALEEARRLIEKHGYGRRKEELATATAGFHSPRPVG